MTLRVDGDHLGTPEVLWRATLPVANMVPLDICQARRLVLVAPHPDDEVFGAGGLIQSALYHEVPVRIIAVTDGEASHPRSEHLLTRELTARRIREREEALHRLGWREPDIVRLHLPDSGVANCLAELTVALRSQLQVGDVCAAPWQRDGHPDHDACGRAARQVCGEVGTTLLSYFVWTWHWASPEAGDVPWSQCRRLDLDRRARARKRWATRAFESQIQPLGPVESDVVLPASVLRHFWRPYEIYLDHEGES